MNQGIGVRYTTSGVRVLGLKRTGDGIEITKVAVSLPEERLESIITNLGFSTEDSRIACGLCPGDFISVVIARENGMDDQDLRSQLRWEIERKMISDPSEYSIDYTMSDNMGLVFAGRRKFIDELKGTLKNVVFDVEPVALYNGCESLGELGDGKLMLLSVEAEGISSVVMNEGMLQSMESFPIHEDELLSVLGCLDHKSIAYIDDSTSERLAEYINESINRFNTYIDKKKNAIPDRLILAGGGVYAGELARLVEQKSGITTIVSDPFASQTVDSVIQTPELANMGAAFTTCFGLAVRALEE